MVVAAPEHEPVLGPDHLRPDLEAARLQARGHRRRVQGAVPDVSDDPGEQRPGLAPIGTVVVLDLAHPLRAAEPGAVPPCRIVFDTKG